MNVDLLQRLDPTPVAGVDMSNVSLLRLDLSGGLAPGNKAFKLRHNLVEAHRRGVHRVVSFGGGWSNHLHALAAVGREQGLETVGLLRGEAQSKDTPMLADARAWGMHIEHISRTQYRRRNDPAFLEQVAQRFAPCLVIPEGGANDAGVRGCMDITGLITAAGAGSRHIVMAVGTGTTLAGVAAGLGRDYEVTGISALKGASDLEERVQHALDSCALGDVAQWRILHDYHCGGFARSNAQLQDFMLEFERIQGVLLDPVYTGKMLLAVHQLLASGELQPAAPVVAIHTGGIQGRRGFSWLDAG